MASITSSHNNSSSNDEGMLMDFLDSIGLGSGSASTAAAVPPHANDSTQDNDLQSFLDEVLIGTTSSTQGTVGSTQSQSHNAAHNNSNLNQSMANHNVTDSNFNNINNQNQSNLTHWHTATSSMSNNSSQESILNDAVSSLLGTGGPSNSNNNLNSLNGFNLSNLSQMGAALSQSQSGGLGFGQAPTVPPALGVTNTGPNSAAATSLASLGLESLGMTLSDSMMQGLEIALQQQQLQAQQQQQLGQLGHGLGLGLAQNNRNTSFQNLVQQGQFPNPMNSMMLPNQGQNQQQLNNNIINQNLQNQTNFNQQQINNMNQNSNNFIQNGPGGPGQQQGNRPNFLDFSNNLNIRINRHASNQGNNPQGGQNNNNFRPHYRDYHNFRHRRYLIGGPSPTQSPAPNPTSVTSQVQSQSLNTTTSSTSANVTKSNSSTVTNTVTGTLGLANLDPKTQSENDSLLTGYQHPNRVVDQNGQNVNVGEMWQRKGTLSIMGHAAKMSDLSSDNKNQIHEPENQTKKDSKDVDVNDIKESNKDKVGLDPDSVDRNINHTKSESNCNTIIETLDNHNSITDSKTTSQSLSTTATLTDSTNAANLSAATLTTRSLPNSATEETPTAEGSMESSEGISPSMNLPVVVSTGTVAESSESGSESKVNSNIVHNNTVVSLSAAPSLMEKSDEHFNDSNASNKNHNDLKKNNDNHVEELKQLHSITTINNHPVPKLDSEEVTVNQGQEASSFQDQANEAQKLQQIQSSQQINKLESAPTLTLAQLDSINKNDNSKSSLSAQQFYRSYGGKYNNKGNNNGNNNNLKSENNHQNAGNSGKGLNLSNPGSSSSSNGGSIFQSDNMINPNSSSTNGGNSNPNRMKDNYNNNGGTPGSGGSNNSNIVVDFGDFIPAKQNSKARDTRPENFIRHLHEFPPGCYRLFLGGLHAWTTESHILAYFQAFVLKWEELRMMELEKAKLLKLKSSDNLLNSETSSNSCSSGNSVVQMLAKMESEKNNNNNNALSPVTLDSDDIGLSPHILEQAREFAARALVPHEKLSILGGEEKLMEFLHASESSDGSNNSMNQMKLNHNVDVSYTELKEIRDSLEHLKSTSYRNGPNNMMHNNKFNNNQIHNFNKMHSHNNQNSLQNALAMRGKENSPINTVEVRRCGDTGRSRYFGFCSFKTVEHAKICFIGGPHEIGGRFIDIRPKSNWDNPNNNNNNFGGFGSNINWKNGPGGGHGHGGGGHNGPNVPLTYEDLKLNLSHNNNSLRDQRNNNWKFGQGYDSGSNGTPTPRHHNNTGFHNYQGGNSSPFLQNLNVTSPTDHSASIQNLLSGHTTNSISNHNHNTATAAGSGSAALNNCNNQMNQIYQVNPNQIQQGQLSIQQPQIQNQSPIADAISTIFFQQPGGNAKAHPQFQANLQAQCENQYGNTNAVANASENQNNVENKPLKLQTETQLYREGSAESWSASSSDGSSFQGEQQHNYADRSNINKRINSIDLSGQHNEQQPSSQNLNLTTSTISRDGRERSRSKQRNSMD